MHYFSNLANYVPAEGQYYLLPPDCLQLMGIVFNDTESSWLGFSQMTMDLPVWIPGSSLKCSGTT